MTPAPAVLGNVAVLLLLHFGIAAGASLRARQSLLRSSKPALETYSFAQFMKDFDRNYVVGTQEFHDRAATFQASLGRARAINYKNAQEGRTWSSGIHPFMDWTQAERQTLHGYKPSGTRSQRATASAGFAGVQMQAGSVGSLGLTTNSTASSNVAMSQEVPVRQQGGCGSCWAISAVEAVEARLQGERLAAQALVDCVPNPNHCGGTGGCDGATGELAYEFMRDHGIPLESSLPYDAETGPCPAAPLTGAWPNPKRARVSGWSQLPSNKAEPLMQALVEQGPVVVAVDGNKWFDYDSGIFDGCDRDAILGHAVLAKEYGTDQGTNYWRIQNSWGTSWGEQGHIRLKRMDNEDSWCGTDSKPSEGVGCDGGPAEVTVCGMCGLLYDPLFPVGVRLEDADPSEEDAAVARQFSEPAETFHHKAMFAASSDTALSEDAELKALLR